MSPAGGGRRIFSETTTAPGVRRGIGSALALLPLLVCCGLVSPAPVLTRRTRWAAGILMVSLASLALLLPAPAEAQTSVNVSNITEADESTGVANGTNYLANAFTTGGSTTDRFTLNSVVLRVTPGGGQFDVSIHNASGSNPGTKIGNSLSGTASSTGGNKTYTASGITLNGGTTYFVRVIGPTDGRSLDVTTSTAQTGTAGWSIADGGRRSTDSGTTWNAFGGGGPSNDLGRMLLFTVNATAVSTQTPPPRTRPRPQLTLSLSSERVREGSSVTVTATLSKALRKDVELRLGATAGGGSRLAHEEGDLTFPTITVPAGRTSATGTITANQDDDIDEEYAWVRLMAFPIPLGFEALLRGVALYVDDDDTTGPTNFPPDLTLEHGGVKNALVRGVREGTTAQMTVKMARAWTTAVTIPLRVAVRASPHPLDAEASDYSIPSSVVMPAGQTSVNFNLQAAQDADRDDEWLFVLFDSSGLPSWGPRPELGSYLQVEIVDDDRPAGTGGQGEEDAAAGTTLSVAPNPVEEGSPVTVTRVTSDAGDHGTLPSIAIAAGQTTGTGAIATHVDLDGDDETFTVALDTASLPASLTAGSPSSVTVTIDDTTEGTTVTPPAAWPGAPTGLAASPAAGQVTLTWNAYSGAFGWEVSSDGGTTWATVAGATGSTTTHTVTGLTDGTEYTFKVRATWMLPSVKGTASAGVTETAGLRTAESNLSPPGPVTNIRVTHNGTSFDVTWDAPAGATHYDVTYYGGGVNARAAWNRKGTSLNITCDVRDGYGSQNCVTGSASYTVGVRARNGGGAGEWRDSAEAQPPSPPGPVTNIQVAHKGTSLAVSWDAPSGATHYDVTYYRHDTKVNARGAWNRKGTSLAITKDSRDGYDNTINSNATYTVGVRARNAAGESAWANSAAAAAPALSVADTSVNEPSEGLLASLDFTVTLEPAASWTVTVDYATGGGDATAGSDYTSTSGRLTFAAGETTKTISVPVLADSHDDSGETLTLTLSNATGAKISDAEATGTITNDGPIPAAWNARFGRTVADQVLEGVETRLRSEPTPGMDVYLAGERLEWTAGSDGTQPVAQQVADQLAQWLVVGSGDNGDAAVRTLNGDDLLSSSSFALASPVSGDGLLSFWGRGAVTNFDGRDGELSLDGEVTTVMLGTDWRWGQWPDGGEGRRSIAGLLLSRSTADGGYAGSEDTGEVDATLTGVFPWIGHRFSHQLEAWGAAGYGQGELEVTPKLDTGKDGATLTADLNLWLAAGGLRGTLVDGGSEGLTITGKGDAMVVGTSSGETRGMKAAEATVTRVRLGLEAHRPFALGNPESGAGAMLTPSLELGLRHDGGDAETGFGLDLGGGIVLSHPERGLQAEVRGRGLLSHASEGFRDRGFSGSLSWQQQPDSDRGAALSLSQTMGGLSSGGADALLSRATLEGLAADNDGSKDDLNNRRLELQLSYGLPAFGDRFTLTPEVGLGFYDNGRDYRLGWSLTQPDGGESFAFSFDVTRRESANNSDAPEHGVELRLDTLF